MRARQYPSAQSCSVSASRSWWRTWRPPECKRAAASIPCIASHASPISVTAAGGALELDDKAFPNAMEAYERGLLLPLYPALSEDDVQYICAAIRAFYGEGQS